MRRTPWTFARALLVAAAFALLLAVVVGLGAVIWQGHDGLWVPLGLLLYLCSLLAA